MSFSRVVFTDYKLQIARDCVFLEKHTIVFFPTTDVREKERAMDSYETGSPGGNIMGSPVEDGSA